MAAAIPTQIEKCKGAMLATAIGDALGWPNEQRSKNKVKNSKVNDYFVGWTRHNTKPCCHDEKILPGEYSDDTQMTLSVARSIIAGNWEKFFTEKELPFWLSYERGGGGALLKAAKSCKEGILPWQSNCKRDYFNAGGNGAVMRILPHVVANTQKFDIASLMLDVIKDTLITHGHPRAVLGATCYAFALDYLLRKETVLEYGELVTAVIDGQKAWGAYLNEEKCTAWLEAANRQHNFEYASEWARVLSSMIKQLEFIQGSLKKGLIMDDVSVLTQLGCFSKADGAGDVAILAAIYLASRYANNPVLGIKVPAFSFGADTDTIASITGGLLGMLCGINWIPTEWKVVQDYECLIRITNLLLTDNSKQAAKANLSEAKSQESDWINTAIGRMRRLCTETVQSGKYAIVIITKWQSALGQTLYTKDMQKLENQQLKRQIQTPLQLTLYDVSSQGQSKAESQPLIKAYATEPVQTNTLQRTQQRFVLDETSVVDLLSNPQFNEKITCAKVLRIVQALMEGSQPNSAIAKQFKVEQTLVALIKAHVMK